MWSIGELVVLPDQLVRAVVFIGDGGRPPGDLGYVPIVVIGVFVDVIAAVLFFSKKDFGEQTAALSHWHRLFYKYCIFIVIFAKR